MNSAEKIIRKILREVLLKWRIKSRYVIERKMFPRIKNKKVLFVGCAEYTKDYPSRIEKNNNQLWTLDIDPEVAKYGAKNHIIGDAVEINKYFQENFFDVIMMIGVFGYGINKKEDADKSLENCAKILKKEGAMIIHWSNITGKDMVKPRKLDKIKLYSPTPMFGLPELYIINKGTKIFEFYKKN
jgi:ubiquinone/menaquinone biosynthesis C-methylase UbiE